MSAYLRDDPFLKCPQCSSQQLVVSEKPLCVEIAKGYALEIRPLSDRQSYSGADLARKVLSDFESGILSEREVLDQYDKAYHVSVRIDYQCSVCGAKFASDGSCSIIEDYYDAFWKRLKETTDSSLIELIGIDCDQAETYTENYDIIPLLVEYLHKGNPSIYKELKRLKDLTVRLPAERGGEPIQEIISVVLISILSAAIYDMAKASGIWLVRKMKSALRNRRLHKIVGDSLNSSDVSEIMRNISDRELLKLIGNTHNSNLTVRQKRLLIEKAVIIRARELRRKLIAAAKKKGKQTAT
jgi:hypothetical protein